MITTDTQERRLTQLMLFEERPILPKWAELSEATRKEAVQHLAQLLGSVHEESTGCGQVPGGQNE